MAFQTRRVVVSNDATGKSTVVSDEVLSGETASTGDSRCEIWVTDRMPVNNTASTLAEQQQGVVDHFDNLYVNNGQGTAFRVMAFAPNEPAVFHRTQSVDYDVVLSGEFDLHLDDETVRLRTGDSVVVRGVYHGWSNPGKEPAVIAFIMIDADPVVVDGKTLGEHYPDGQNPFVATANVGGTT